MRVLTLLAALVAVGGIIATSVFARRREWAVLRAMGMQQRRPFAALALETLLVMAIGGICGAIGGSSPSGGRARASSSPRDT